MSVLLNTLFVTADKAAVHKDGDGAVVRVDGEERARVPLLHLQAIVCIGPVWVSPDLMAALIERGGHVGFLGPTGRMLARAEGLPGGNVLLRRAQFRAADDQQKSLELSRSFVIGKVVNQRQLLLHAARDSEGTRKESIQQAAEKVGLHLREAERAATLDALRGVEGIAARDYFSAFPSLVRKEEEAFRFAGRSRRPPGDRINALLSFGYALLMQDCVAACSSIGLDPAVGFLHEDRPGRLALALDLMEELRAPVVDRLVLALINRGQIDAADVMQDESDGFLLSKTGRKTFVGAYQDARQLEIQHRFLDQTVAWGRVPNLQALLLARVLRGDLDQYPPFTIR
jgi:CRISP-associated protein Cas1